MDLDGMLRGWAARIVRFASIASAKSDGSCELTARRYGAGPTPPSIPSRLMFPFGLRSVPPAGVDACEVKGGRLGSMTVACDSSRYGPSDLVEDGSETALYNTENARAVVAKGAEVIVNEGTLKVARDTDPVGCGSVTAVVAQAGPLVTVTFAFVPQGGGAPVPWFAFTATGTGTPGTYTMTLPGKITNGAANFKG